MTYRTSKEQNEILTRVGAGTPMGELLRRYWWPVALSADLKEKPTLIRLLGQDLVLFRDRRGRLGVLDAQCPHRRAPLCIGTPHPEGLRCRYHGWLIDRGGNLLEVPGEPEAHALKAKVKHGAYPAEELGGLIFTYLGPQPAPELPRFHMLAAEGQRTVAIQGFNDCNFLQCVENGIDPYHASFLHGDVWKLIAPAPDLTWFENHEYGVTFKSVRPGREAGEFYYREHPLIMPGISVGGDQRTNLGQDLQNGSYPATAARWSVPIDDTHTVNFRVFYRPGGQETSALERRVQSAEPTPIRPYREYKAGLSELGYTMEAAVYEEDATVFDGIGVIADRENENLCATDGGVVLLREMLLRQLAVIQRGEDPIGVIRDKAKNAMLVVTGDYHWISAEEYARLTAEHGPKAASRTKVPN